MPLRRTRGFLAAVTSADAERQKARRDEGRRGEEDILCHYRRLEEQLGSTYYFCGAFSAADIALFMTTHYAIRLNGPSLQRFQALAVWYRRVGERPSAVRVVKEIAAADRKLSWPLGA